MPSLYDEYPFLMNYFNSGISNNNKSISHCILLYGSDIDAQYAIALEIARLLNCKESKKVDCQCLNCKWIKENKHPAVITVSRTDFKPDDDNSKTVISIRQTQEIRSILMMTSEYQRVIIFCDRNENGELQGLNYKVFQEEAANSLLKTLEEPPQNTTFIILTKNKSDMISTIVSRAQSFFVPSKKISEYDTEQCKDLVGIYLSQNKNSVWKFQDKLTELTEKHSPDEILNCFQYAIYFLLKENFRNKNLSIKLNKDLKSIEEAKKQIQLSMSTKSVIENLSYKIF